MHARNLIPLLLLAALAACAPAAAPADEAVVKAGRIEITGAWVRPVTLMPGTETGHMEMAPNAVVSAAYFTIRNTGGEADKLLSVSSEVAEAVELHNVTMENNIMSMTPVQFLEVPAGERVALKPGGHHLMLIGVTRELKVGDRVALTLNFEKAGSVTLEAEVRENGG